jgi:hypothetical protein
MKNPFNVAGSIGTESGLSMGATKEGFYNTVERDLKKAYRNEEGWTLERRPRIDGVDPDYLLIRKKPGMVERILVNVKIAAEIPATDFDALTASVMDLKARKMPVTKALLVVPRDVKVPADTKGVDLFYLNSYAVKSGEVIWGRSSLRAEDGTPVLA